MATPTSTDLCEAYRRTQAESTAISRTATTMTGHFGERYFSLPRVVEVSLHDFKQSLRLTQTVTGEGPTAVRIESHFNGIGLFVRRAGSQDDRWVPGAASGTGLQRTNDRVPQELLRLETVFDGEQVIQGDRCKRWMATSPSVLVPDAEGFEAVAMTAQEFYTDGEGRLRRASWSSVVEEGAFGTVFATHTLEYFAFGKNFGLRLLGFEDVRFDSSPRQVTGDVLDSPGVLGSGADTLGRAL